MIREKTWNQLRLFVLVLINTNRSNTFKFTSFFKCLIIGGHHNFHIILDFLQNTHQGQSCFNSGCILRDLSQWWRWLNKCSIGPYFFLVSRHPNYFSITIDTVSVLYCQMVENRNSRTVSKQTSWRRSLHLLLTGKQKTTKSQNAVPLHVMKQANYL